ncbi:hypothetical protein H0H87_000126 [Tephrocybe sp. NHM501043]|nr:hypothetical protein H0H87_000126 [Tephrocybe sp. NHM501043]
MRPRDYMSPSPATSPSPTPPLLVKPKAWYLEVASPTWEDMRTLGKASVYLIMLHLHPLTLEDILQQDPREKLELFPKLGYYFISFRAIEARPRHGIERKEGFEALDDSASDAGTFGEANVYLVVFKEGICSFHFTNISEHTNRVRGRIRLLQEAINMSSDWIAHGILDSIVDSFFPLLEEIEREVVAIEDLVLTAGNGAPYPGAQQLEVSSSRMPRACGDRGRESSAVDEKDSWPHLEIEKLSTANADVRFRSPQLTTSLVYRRIKRTVSKQWHKLWAKDFSQPGSTQTTLGRMARTRRLVTSLTRLLATKSEVITQIRKRLMTVNGPPRDDNLDIAMYMGDVQDHILTLQHSLVHYERILSQSHPTYLSQLRTGVAFTKRGTDVSVFYLTTVSLAVMCIQPLIGTMSINVKIPANDRTREGTYHVFGIIISLAICILCAYIYIIRQWWMQAKAKTGQRDTL